MSDSARKLFTVYDNYRMEVNQGDDLNELRPIADSNDGFIVAGAIVYDAIADEDADGPH